MVRHLTFALLPLFFLVSCSQLQNQDDFRLRWSQLEEEGYNQADVEAEVRFGREVAARFLGARDGVDNRTLQTYVNTVGQYVAQYSGRDDIEFFFWVIEDEVINAYTLIKSCCTSECYCQCFKRTFNNMVFIFTTLLNYMSTDA